MDIHERRDYDRAYYQTDKCKATRKAYRRSVKGKEHSDKRKGYHKAYDAARSAKSRSKPRGYDLYIMKIPNHGNWYKVGCAADPHWRARNLSAGYPWKVEIVKIYDGCGKYEETVHDKLKPFMISGRGKNKTEWFEIPEDELIKQIEDVLIVELF